jgi:hypothetical protein
MKYKNHIVGFTKADRIKYNYKKKMAFVVIGKKTLQPSPTGDWAGDHLCPDCKPRL